MKRSFILLLLFFFIGQVLIAQVKYEKESRIKSEKVPIEAKKFVNALPFTAKIKWYLEEGIEQTSIEAKTKYEGQQYSIEFDANGQLEDVEIRIKWEELSPQLQTKLNSFFANEYLKASIKKIQIQYISSADNMVQYLSDTTKDQGISTNYELVVKVRDDGGSRLEELLFDAKGQLKKRSIIIFKNTDNLEY